ncbi:MAG: glycine oxidase ThiO [Zetaproteobacteria bacterium]|nr:glycine oxidase ThiO [Zetaproteobacteria bacterium]
MRVVIVGGGIIGCLTACYLKQRGASPVVVEKERMGQESSWAGAGILCPIQPWLYPDEFSHLINASLALYPALRDQLEAATGISIEWQQSGLIAPFFDFDRSDDYHAALNWSARLGWKVESLTPEAAVAQEPMLSRDHLTRALHWPDVAQLRNPRLLKAVRAWMEQLAIPIHEGRDVIHIEEKNNQSISVQTRDGQSLEAEHVLMACGSWSGDLAARIGFQLPVQPVKGQIVLLKDHPGLMKHIVKHESIYFVPRRDGRILAGASLENVGFQTGNTVRVVSKILSDIQRVASGLLDVEIEQQWMGFRPGSPDGMPYLGIVPGFERLWVASGHYRNGVALAPITATAMSQRILTGDADIDLAPFSLQRSMENVQKIGYPV